MGNTMNKSELAKAVAQSTGMTKSQAAQAVDATFGCISDSLKGRDRVALAGFGTFLAKTRAAREGRNPRTGEKVQISARTSAAFRPASALKNI